MQAFPDLSGPGLHQLRLKAVREWGIGTSLQHEVPFLPASR